MEWPRQATVLVSESSALRSSSPGTGPAELTSLPQLSVRARELRPFEAFVAVKYRGTWYWIDDRDFASKRVFSVLMLLLNLVDKGREVQLPVITIPTG